MGGIKNSFIVVSKKKKIGGILDTCFNQKFFHSSQPTTYNSQPIYPTATTKPNRHVATSKFIFKLLILNYRLSAVIDVVFQCLCEMEPNEKFLCSRFLCRIKNPR